MEWRVQRAEGGGRSHMLPRPWLQHIFGHSLPWTTAPPLVSRLYLRLGAASPWCLGHELPVDAHLDMALGGSPPTGDIVRVVVVEIE